MTWEKWDAFEQACVTWFLRVWGFLGAGVAAILMTPFALVYLYRQVTRRFK